MFGSRESSSTESGPRLTIRTCSAGAVCVGRSELFTGTMSELLVELDGLSRRETPQLVVTVNVDQVLEMQDSARFANIVANANIRTIDGAPLALLARILSKSQVHRNTGADLLPALVDHYSKQQNKVVAIIGGSEVVSQKAASNLSRNYSGVRVQSVQFPFVDSIEDHKLANVIETITLLKPDAVFICLGSPKQEYWFKTWESMLPPAIYIGAGAAVDFAANNKKRAPQIVQKIGFEWAWRLLQEPRRLWKRYLVRGPQFISIAIRSLFTQ